MDILEYAANELLSRKQSDSFRVRRKISSAQGAEVSVDGKKFLNFCSNDYLGLANHKEIIDALKFSADQYGVGSGASQMVCGYSDVHKALEERLACFVGRQRALFFSTGYMANLAMVNAFIDRKDEIFADRLVHASIIDAANLSRAKLKRYGHCDRASLARALDGSGANNKLVITESVFSMDGDVAPLLEIAGVCEEHSAWLAVDDAHAFGMLGKKGTGSLEYFDLTEKEVPLLMATLGKALGCFGAFVAGEDDVIEELLQSSRPYIYTTAPPPALAAAGLKALDVMQKETWRRDRLFSLIDRFRMGATQQGLTIGDSKTPIQPLVLGTNKNALNISHSLYEKGILITAIRPPTVPEGTARLRITLSASHTEEQIDKLLDMLGQCMKICRGEDE